MGREYSLTELFVIKFVLADIVIIAALLFAGPLYAVAITALLIVSIVLVWYLMERTGDSRSESEPVETDPITTLQNRYAAGELSETAFETKLEQVIEANERADRAGVDTAELSLERTD